MLSCTENKSTILETPFVTVVKLVSAEQSLAFEEAIQYIDVIQVYSKLGLENPESDWKRTIKLQYNLGKDKKISNDFKRTLYTETGMFKCKLNCIVYKKYDVNYLLVHIYTRVNQKIRRLLS